MRTVYADAETAGFAQSEIDKAGLGDKLRVECHPYMPLGALAVVVDGAARLYSAELMDACYAGWNLLLAD
jgi:hypothetical protein